MKREPAWYSQDTVHSLLEKLATTDGERVYLIDPETGRGLTFSETRRHAINIADHIASRGVQPGEAVAYAFSNSLDSAVTILGILYGGFLATSINLVAGADTIAYVLEHSEARLIVTDSKGETLVRNALNGVTKRPQFVDVADMITTTCGTQTVLTPPDSMSNGLLMYTSGTTGRPKGVVHTHSSLLCGGENTATAHELSQNDCGLCVLPFYHINAFCVSLMGTLVSGGTLVIPGKFSVSTFWDTIKTYGCTWFSVVPTQISYLLHHSGENDNFGSDSRSLRFGRSASAPLSPDVHEAFERRFGVPIVETMGLTETAAQILSNPLPPGRRKIGSPGLAVGNEVIIADDKQLELPSGEEGEILVRGPNVLREYFKNDVATAETITQDGWLRTGDLGKMDNEGYVFVTGRLKELIIKGGENIAPREVDEALYGHPEVIEAAAFGVECSDYGQRVEAAVKVHNHSSDIEDELLKLCQTRLGSFKSPDRIHILPELPKGPSGKIQRIKLRDLLRGSPKDRISA